MQTAELKPLMNTLAPIKVIGAHLKEPAYEVAVQDICWTAPGAINVLSGRHCLIELAEAPRAGRAQYLVAGADGHTRPAGRLNFMPPASTRAVYWSEGTRHTTLCVMEPDRLGLLGSIDWCWDDVDPASTIDVHNDRLQLGMQWLSQETLSPSFASGLCVSSLLTMLAIDLHRHCLGASRAPVASPGKLSTQQLRLLKDLVEGSNDPCNLTLAEMAAACRLPARELSTMFKKTVGQTLRSYVAATHIERAKVLLDDADLLIKQVAYRSGFRSAAAFGDAFRRATGSTPVQYRQVQGVACSGG
jgi:AraC family transcriptional regulator